MKTCFGSTNPLCRIVYKRKSLLRSLLFLFFCLLASGCGLLAPDYSVPAFTMTGGVAGEALGGTFVIMNTGDAAGNTTINWTIYHSANGSFDAADTQVASGTVPAVAAGAVSEEIAFSGSWPPNAGTYYFIAVITADDDSDPVNNQGISNPVNVTLEPVVDYSVPPFFVTGGVAGSLMSEAFTIANNGSLAGGSAVTWTAYLSINDTYDLVDTEIASSSISALGVGAISGEIPLSSVWPETAGNYYIVVVIAAEDDGNSENDTGAAAVTVTPVPVVDYAVVDAVYPGGGRPDDLFSGSFRIENQNTAAGGEEINWAVYLSTDDVLDTGSDTAVDSGVHGALGAEARSPVIIFNGRWPTGEDTYYLFITIEALDDEVDGNNESSSDEIQTSLPLGIDYIISSPDIPSSGTVDEAFSGSFMIRNNGATDGGMGIFWYVYLSDNNFYDAGDELLSSSIILDPLTAGEESAQLDYNGTWPATPLTYYLFIRISGSDDSDLANNELMSAPIEIDIFEVFDYAVVNEPFPVAGTTGGSISGSFRVSNVGDIDGAEDIDWAVYYSTSEIVDENAVTIVSGIHSALEVGAATNTIVYGGTWPETAADYYLIIELYSSEDENSANDTAASSAITVIDSGRFVAVGKSGTIMYSDNGAVSWVGAAIVPDFSGDFVDVATNGLEHWVAVGDNKTVYHSDDDGVSWQPAVHVDSGTDDIYAIAHHNGIWVAPGYEFILYSEDGMDWYDSTVSGMRYCNAATWDFGQERWITTGLETTVTGVAVTSSDGLVWSSTFATSADIRDIFCSPEGRLVGAGHAGSSFSGAAYSLNGGESWNEATVEDGDTYHELNGVAYNGTNTYVTVEGDGIFYYSTDDGENWYISTIIDELYSSMYDVAYDTKSGRFVAVGHAGRVYFSTNDGYDWTRSTDGPPTHTSFYFNGIAVGP